LTGNTSRHAQWIRLTVGWSNPVLLESVPSLLYCGRGEPVVGIFGLGAMILKMWVGEEPPAALEKSFEVRE
jgi:hypothetical protein